MKISLRWLNDHIDVLDYLKRPEELARLLTDVGLEVEAVDNPAQRFQNIVVGHILKLERHPNADRLTVCQVDVGEGTPRQIVCGAKNHKAGDKVVVTLPGAVLPGDFVIKKSKIRDVESHGMMASESELGLAEESEGIMILPESAPVGQPFAEYQGLDDVILEINVSPNRADCLSHLGLARELSCLLQRPLKKTDVKIKTSSSVVTKKTINLQVKDAKLCPRYAGRVIQGVKVGPSPAWLKRRLESVGLNSINNVVDVTNFIMMDLGQPLHAFDAQTLKGNTIIVDRAQPREAFKTLDGTEMTLTGDELTIRDGERAVCIAGVIGGLNSGVTDKTTTLFIESAHFAMDSVRRTSRRHGLQTDSAYRFSRGTDISGVQRALERACALIQEVAGGEVAEDFWDVQAPREAQAPIEVKVKNVGQRLGYPVEEKEFQQWMERLHCKVESKGSGTFFITPPEFRVDLEREIDLIEEFGRLNGYDRIPETLPVLSYSPLSDDREYSFTRRLMSLARSVGFDQCVNFGFVSAKYQSDVMGPGENYKVAGLEVASQAVPIRNPLSEDYGVMRVSLLPGLLKNLLHNYRHGNEEGRLFELGEVFRHGADGYVQDPRLSFVLWGRPRGLWDKTDREDRVFFALKGAIEEIFRRLSLQQVQWNAWKNPPELLHPGQAATVFCEGRNIGFVGTLHPHWTAEQKIRVPVAVAELDVRALSRGQPRAIKFQSVSKYPMVERDLAFVLPKDMRAQDVATEIKKAAGPMLQSISIFDVFSGESLPPDHVSVAYRMLFQATDGTLTEDKLTSLQQQIVSSVEKKLAVKVR